MGLSISNRADQLWIKVDQAGNRVRLSIKVNAIFSLSADAVKSVSTFPSVPMIRPIEE